MLIAQVTDIHASRNNDNLRRFDRALEWLEHINPDVLVLTGDLIDEQWHEGYQLIFDRLSQKKWPSLVMPGNSDDRGMMRSIWGTQGWAEDAPDNSLHFVHHLSNIRLIGLDSTIEGKNSGDVINHLEWLEKQLQNGVQQHRFYFCIIMYLNLAFPHWMRHCVAVPESWQN